jgi:hypothetical protein
MLSYIIAIVTLGCCVVNIPGCLDKNVGSYISFVFCGVVSIYWFVKAAVS